MGTIYLKGTYYGLPYAGILHKYFTAYVCSRCNGNHDFMSGKKRSISKCTGTIYFDCTVNFSGILFNMEGMADYISYIMISKWGMEALGSIADLNNLQLKIQMTIPNVPHDFENRFKATSDTYSWYGQYWLDSQWHFY